MKEERWWLFSGSWQWGQRVFLWTCRCHVFVPMYASVAEEGYLISYIWVYLSFSPLLFASLLFTAICKASSDLSDQCKEREENNRMGKTRDLVKKIRDTKGPFHAKMGSVKDRNGMDLTEAEDIKKRWQEYTEELYKKDLHNPENHDGVITHLGPEILECEVKWALESITTNKATGGDGIPGELFQILKDDAVKVLHSICQQIRKLSSGHRTGKGQFSFQSQRKAMPKNAQNTAQLHSSHTLVK